MSVISDAIDSLETWCSNLFKDGIKSQFDGISNLLTDTFSTTTGDSGLVNTYLASHPANFTGGATAGTSIWTTIETLCNNVVVPIGGFILTIILLNDLIHTVIRGNNFKDFDDSIFIKWIIKALCGVILVSNVYYNQSIKWTNSILFVALAISQGHFSCFSAVYQSACNRYESHGQLFFPDRHQP